MISFTHKLYRFKLSNTFSFSLFKIILPKKLPSFSESGMVMEEELAELRADVKAINPMIEVYLLDTMGKILGYAAPVAPSPRWPLDAKIVAG